MIELWIPDFGILGITRGFFDMDFGIFGCLKGFKESLDSCTSFEPISPFNHRKNPTNLKERSE
jgi:hypothetical protein